jgi:flagellar M-ring protein FliF
MAIMGMIVLGLIGFFIFLLTRLATPQLSLLYGSLSKDDSNRIIQQLQTSGVPVEVRNNGSEVLVPTEKVAELRIAMADQGLPSGGSVGYEIFDTADSLGTTNFIQNVNLVRALEGELARTIRAINTVQAARVHLVMPRRQLFSREQQQPTASVVLNMRGASRLTNEQITAVQHLTAAAVPGLSPNRISIVDNKGSLLARGFDDKGTPGGSSAKSEDRKMAFESRMARTIEELLEKTVGLGKVRAEVRAEMDFDRITSSEETYNPEGQVVRSTQTTEETEKTREAEVAPVSVGSNLPDPTQTAGEGANNASERSRANETVNFEISKKVTSLVREGGIVNRLSVAVLVDGNHAKPDDDGNRAYTKRDDKEMELLATLVRSTVGFDADRGDVVEVINMRFAAPELPEEPPLELFLGFDKNDMLRMAEILVLSIVAILVILLVVRPLVTRAFEAMPSAAEAAESRLLGGPGAAALAGPGMPGLLGMDGDDDEDQFDDLIDIDRVEGRVKASSVNKVGEIVDKHPEEALSIVRSWMYQETA